MTNDQERAAHHAAQAEELLEKVGGRKLRGADVQIMAARASTHATLAVYYGMEKDR